MTEKKTKSIKNKQNRRNFIKNTVAGGLGVATLGLGSSNLLKAANKNGSEIKPHKVAFKIKEYDRLEDIYKIDPNYKRMRQKNTIFSRAGWDPKMGMGNGQGRFISFAGKWQYMTPNPLIESGEPGFSKLEHALESACFAGQVDTTGGSGAGTYNEGIFHDWDRFSNPKIKEKYPFKSSEEAAKYIKRGAHFLGADDVGIAPFDERWIYDRWYNVGKAMNFPGMPEGNKNRKIEEQAKFPFEVKSVIVTIHAMDKDAMKSPGFLMDAAAGLEYAHMAEAGHKISVFLNNLGYKAAPAGNCASLSVPTALQAGLGENSRMGTLIHPKFGPGVRIEKIYTDLEIKPDKPITFGVQEFCRKCKKCADLCPADALSWEEEPTEKPSIDSISSHPGVTKWYQDNEKCIGQWEKYGTGCGWCLSVCPYNKPENWVHDVAKIAVGIPVGRDIARILDDSFGYGDFGPKNVKDFWNKKIK